ncbi:ABC transporter ATP-binding protein [Leucobacter sp. wl10]|uniref:ABC transporter ATP-binding protein n=1 Tax=Leucobacter sp. wl10 TaxID=2304677 RepID=UPI000E5AEE31|nr:ABC transporter ATP-binding protein [Leucobacter sp. wl10]RGE23676.1 ABC transporter ATP-binding protein [Leucobacter sp. wl10]
MTNTNSAGASGLILSQLTKVYGDRTVLRAIDLDVRPGELVTLLGPSGCGKSTALKIIGGFEQATSGRVVMGGTDMTRTPARERGTGIVFQQYSLFPHITAVQNIEFGLKVKRVGRVERRARSEELLALVGLEEHAGKYPHQLSGGQQQRVALARALAVEPRVLLLDEPLSALDALVRERLREEIVRIHRERGTTTIMVTHDQEEALAMADRVAVMHEGRIAQFDTPQALYRSPEPGFVASFIGVMNRIRPEQVTETDVRVFGSAQPIADVRLDENGELLLRPEDLDLAPIRDLRERNDGQGIITDLTLRGGFTSATVLLEDLDRSVRVDMPTGRAVGLRTGDRVQVSTVRRGEAAWTR